MPARASSAKAKQAHTAQLLLAAAAVLAITWPFFLPGEFGLRDMVVTAQQAVTAASVGAGSLPPRAVAQDAFLATTTAPITALRLTVLTAAASAVIGAYAIARRNGTTFWLPAAVIAVWNPLVIERFLQGHWSIVVAAWALVAITAAAAYQRSGFVWAAMWLASLTPTGAIAALITGVTVHRGRRGATAAIGAALCLPWAIPSLLAGHSGAASLASAAAFAPRAEAGVGTLGSLMGLGGIWNAQAVPASRELGLAAAGIALFAVLLAGARRQDLNLLALAGLGFAIPLASWLLPGGFGWLVAHAPGGGLLRDATKWMILCLPAAVTLATRGRTAALVVVLALLQVPDAPWAMRALTPHEHLLTPSDQRILNTTGPHDDILIPDRAPLVRIAGAPAVDPLSKAASLVESGELVVDGILIDAPSPSYREATAAWSAGDVAKVSELGVDVVVDAEGIHRVGPAEVTARYRLGRALVIAWMATPLLIAAWRFRRSRRSARRSSPRKTSPPTT